MAGISIALGLFTIGVFARHWHQDAKETKAFALSAKSTPPYDEALVTITALVALAGVIATLVNSHSVEVRVEGALLGFLATSLAWVMVNATYAARYAHIYYTSGGGINFNGDTDPCFADFFYLSFTIGVSYAVSDSNVSTTELRKVVLRHSLVSYLFTTVIMGMTISFLASLI